MRIYTIYKATCLANDKVYIGFDSSWPRRIRRHKNSLNYNIKETKFMRAMRKHGFESFVWEAIYQSHDRNHTLNVMEAHFIETFDSFKTGYNSTAGGEGGSGVSRKGTGVCVWKGKKRPDISEGQRGEKNHRYGKPAPNKGIEYELMTCPKCGTSGKGGAMTRWHFDNCKEYPRGRSRKHQKAQSFSTNTNLDHIDSVIVDNPQHHALVGL